MIYKNWEGFTYEKTTIKCNGNSTDSEHDWMCEEE